MLLITAVVASAILIAAVFPVVWTMVSTFSSASHDTDTRMRTDFKIVTTWANHNPDSPGPAGGVAKVWMKNIGTNRIGWTEVNQSDVFIGQVGNFDRATLDLSMDLSIYQPSYNKKWAYRIADTNGNGFWDSGETLEVDAYSSSFTASGQSVYFQFVLPNGVYRSSEFTTS